jgi:hypothetical protein
MAAISLLQFLTQTETPMRRGIVQKITNESQFLKLLKFISVDGFAYTYARQDTLGGIAFRGLNASYSADVGIVNPQVESLAIFGGEVRTDYQLVNKQGDVARANAIAAKVKKAGLFFDKYVIGGDPAVVPLSFYGLNGRLTGSQVLSAGANGGPLTLALLDQAIDQTVGAGAADKIIVCSKYVRRAVTALLRPQAHQSAMAASQQVSAYNDVRIIVLDEDGDEQAILPLTETQGSSSLTTSLYVIRLGSDTEGEYCQGLIGSKMIDHLQVGLLGTYYSDIIEANMGLAFFHPRAATRVKGITG